jgi:hypothetical protein
MELVSQYPSVSIEFQCQKHHIPYLRSLWAVLDISAGTVSSQDIRAADFTALPQALEMVRRSISELLSGAWPVSQWVERIWDENDQQAMRDFVKLNQCELASDLHTQSESLGLSVSVQNAGFLSTLWSALESNHPDHKMNLEIAALPMAVTKIQTTLDQLLLPAINQASCFDCLVRKDMVMEIIDHWTPFEKDYISLLVGWILPTVPYSNAHRLN